MSLPELRSALSTRSLLAPLGLLALTVALSIEGYSTLATATAMLFALELSRVLDALGEYDGRLSTLVVGLGLATLGTALALTDGSLLSVLLAVAGGWVVFDAAAELGTGRRRRETGSETDSHPIDEASASEAMATMADARRVQRALTSRSMTRRELAAETGLEDERVTECLDLLVESGTVDREGDWYVTDESALGASGFAREAASLPRRAIGRFVRPFRLLAGRSRENKERVESGTVGGRDGEREPSSERATEVD